MNKKISDCQIVSRLNKLRNRASAAYTNNLAILEIVRDAQKEYLSNLPQHCLKEMLKDIIEVSELHCALCEKRMKEVDVALEMVSELQDSAREIGKELTKLNITMQIFDEVSAVCSYLRHKYSK